MSQISSYPSIFGSHHKEAREVLCGPVVVQEKVDGSQFSFGVGNKGQLHMRSKGAVIHEGNEPAMFKLACETVKELFRQNRLVEGYSYRAEVVTSPKHNVLKYDRIPKGGLVLFDVDYLWDGQDYASPNKLMDIGADLELEVVPLHYEGVVGSFADLEQFMMRESFLGGTIQEGIVVKNYNRFGVDKKILIAKIVRESFKEAHKIQWKTPEQGSVIDEIVKSLKLEGRWQKAVQHLRERGELKEAVQDIGPLLKEVELDTLKEEEDNIKEALFKWAWKEQGLSKKLTAGFPEWYKAKLTELVQTQVKV